MVEGHGVHRVAQAHRRALVGKKFKASSPNGRFVDGARAIDDKALARVEAIGKNLFYFFDRGEGGRGGGSERHGHHVMHVHFGMSGRFSVHAASDPPAATPTTRLKLEGHGRVAMLSAMVVDLMDESGFEAKRVALGQDPLREDACADTLWEKFTASRKSVGLALMDQSMFAGVGNIYRAEILFKAGVHPEQPCRDLDRGAFDSLWRHSVELLQRGYSTGSILTVDPEEALVLGEPWTRRYVYNQSSCGRCGGKVLTWEMANRTVYCCGGSCQKLIESGSSVANPSSGAGAKKTAAAKKVVREHVPFVSHCAPDSGATAASDPSKMTVKALREILAAGSDSEKAVVSASAKKPELVAAVAALLRAAKKEEEYGTSTVARSTPTKNTNTEMRVKVVVAKTSESPRTPTPGTRGLAMRSEADAVRDKANAGEKRNVEHVALEDDASRAVVRGEIERAAAAKGGKKRGRAGKALAPVTPEARATRPRRTK